MCDKYRLESTWKILSLSLLVGIVLGLVTHLPIPPVVIILSSMAAWLVFGVLFRLMIKKD
jgi:small basic protein